MNLIYFVCHDIGRALGCYGAGTPTPNLDAFSREAIRFTNAHCTSPACSPSRACAMTGMYAHRTGAIGLSHMGWPLDLDFQTTVDDFNAAGYQTILSGINHERHPCTDRYETDLSRTWEDWNSARAVDNALNALKSRDTGRPFYLNIATQEPHGCTWHKVESQIPALPDSFPTWVPTGMPRTPALEEAFRKFAASIAEMDRAFGRLIEGLKTLELLDETIVVFTTDHGIAGPRGKGTLYNLGTEIALMIRLPNGQYGGGTRPHLLSNIDYRPTWCEACALQQPRDADGSSFWPAVENPDHPHHEELYLERNYHGERHLDGSPGYVDRYDPVRALRTRDHLYIRYFRPEVKPPAPLPESVEAEANADSTEWERSWKQPKEKRPTEELFDLRKDPHEVHDIAQTPDAASLLSAKRARLEQRMIETGDFLPGQPPARPEEPGWGESWPVDES